MTTRTMILTATWHPIAVSAVTASARPRKYRYGAFVILVAKAQLRRVVPG